MLQIKENFKRKVREKLEKDFKEQFGKEIKAKLEIEEKVPGRYYKTLEKLNTKIENLKKQMANEEGKMPLMPSKVIIKPSSFGKTSSLNQSRRL